MDVFTKKKRSEIMSRIRSRNTALEKNFLKLLSAEIYPKGYRYRKHYRKLSGKPDIVFAGQRVAVFLDGDFWHGYSLKNLGLRVPRKYWLPKIQKNIARDKKHTAKLRKMGWMVLRFWEHDIKDNPARLIKKICEAVRIRG